MKLTFTFRNMTYKNQKTLVVFSAFKKLQVSSRSSQKYEQFRSGEHLSSPFKPVEALLAPVPFSAINTVQKFSGDVQICIFLQKVDHNLYILIYYVFVYVLVL